MNWLLSIREVLPSWLGGVEPPRPVPQTFLEFLRANNVRLGIELVSDQDDSITYKVSRYGIEFTFIVKPASDDQSITVLEIMLPTSDRREAASRGLRQPYNRYLATEFPAEQESLSKKVVLKN